MATPFPFGSGNVLTAAQLNAITTLPVSTKTASHTLTIADLGTRVVMNSASATTITVNTSIFGASDVVEILNIGAGVCTVTAGTCTVGTSANLALAQNAGGKLTFISASASVFVASGGASKVAQVVSVDKLDTFTTSTSSYVDVTGWAATITPTTNTSKVLVFYSTITSANQDYWLGFQIVRGATAVGNGTATGVATAANKASREGAANGGLSVSGMYLDSPATTSATTYKMQIDRNAGTVVLGASYQGANNIDNYSCLTNITLMEILA